MYHNSIQQQYYNQPNMRPSGYQMGQPQPSQALYTQQQIMFMPPPQFSSSAPQVIMPMTATNYPQRMSSPAYQNSMPTTQQGLFQLPQQNTTNFTPHAHTHTYNNPPAVFYNSAQQQNRPPSASGMSGPGQLPAKKRERTVLQIIDPNSGKDICQEVQEAQGTPPSCSILGSHSTSTSDQEHTKSGISTLISENKDQDQNNKKARTSHKMLSTMGLQSPHVETEDSWLRSSSEEDELKSKNRAQDASLAAKVEKNEKQNAVHMFKRKKDQCSPIIPEVKKRYDRKFLLKLQNAHQSMMKPAGLPDIPEIMIEKPSFQISPRDFADEGNIADSTTGYKWTVKSQSGNSHQGKNAPWRGINLEKNIGLSMQKDTSLHPTDGSGKSTRLDEEKTKKPSQSENSTLRAKGENQKQKTIKAKTLDKKVGTVGKPSTLKEGEKNWSGSSLQEHVAKLDNQALVASHTKKTKKNKKQKAVPKPKEDQCSPIIPEVKKRYDRMFLLKLQNARQSMMKPAGLPDIPEIIIEKPNSQLFPRDFADVGNIANFTTGYIFTIKSQLINSDRISLICGGGTGHLAWCRGSIEDRSRSQEGEKTHLPINRSVVAHRLSEDWSCRYESEHDKTMEKPSTPVQELKDDQILSKTHAIMDDYLHKQDVTEAISCIQELSSSGSLHLFVYHALNQVVERSEFDQRKTGLLLHELIKNNVLLVDAYVRGLNEILMHAEDMEIDIPKIWEFLGRLIGPMVQDGSMPLSFLKQVCEPLRASGKSGILIAEILHDASHRKGHKNVARLWAESGLHWSDFVPEKRIDQFLADKKLEYIKVLTNLSSTSMSIDDIKRSLHSLILSCSNEEVFDWINRHVDKPMTKNKDFIDALMSAVCRSAISVDGYNMMKVDKSQIQKRNSLLQKYLDHQLEFELQALYSLQALVHKLQHPPGVLQELFDILYDEDIIPEDAFIQWEKSEDPQEQESKSMALKQVVQFFKWLKEAEDEVQSSSQGKDVSLWYISQNKHENIAIQKDNILIQKKDDAKKSPQQQEKEGAEEEEKKEELEKIDPQNSHQDNGGSGQSTNQENNEILSIQKDTSLNLVEVDARKSTQEEAEGDEVEVEVEEDQNNELQGRHEDKDGPGQSIIQEKNENLLVQKNLSLNQAEDDARKFPQEEKDDKWQDEGKEQKNETSYPIKPSIQPSSYPSQPGIQPPSYPSQPSIQPTSYPRPHSIQSLSYPRQPSIQSPSYPRQPSVQSPSYPSQPNMQTPSYPVVYPQPGQGMYTTSPQQMNTPQHMLPMPQSHYSSTETHVRMPLSGYPNHLNMQPTSYLMGQPHQVYAAAQQTLYTSPQQQMITPQCQQMTTPQHQQLTAQQYQSMTTPQQQQTTTLQQMMFMPHAQYNSVGTQLYYSNQSSMHPPSYPVLQHQPSQMFYTAPQEVMSMPLAQNDSHGTHVSMPVLQKKCLPRKDDNNPDQIYRKEVQEEQNHILMMPDLPPVREKREYHLLPENTSVERLDEQSVQSHLSGDNGQTVIQSQDPSSSRKSSVRNLEWDVMQLEKEKLKLEIEFIKMKYKKIIEETEVLRLQKELLKLQINHFS